MALEFFLNNFIPSIAATVLGGIILTFLIFWFKERVFKLPDIDGRWYFITQTIESAYNPYKEMQLEHVAVLHRESSSVFGSAEKIYEISSTGEREYVGKDRMKGIIKGSIERNFFSKSKLSLHSSDKDFSRESTTFHELLIISKDEMRGYFTSMIADQSGEVVWRRERSLNS